MIASVRIGIAIVVSMLLGFVANDSAISALETSLAGAIGAIVGGVIAALAFVFAVITKLVSRTETADSLAMRYRALTKSLRSDVRWLIWCLAGAVIAPFLRKVDVPFIQYPEALSRFFTKAQCVTAVEVFLVMASISVLFEVCECMFQALVADANTGNAKSDQS
jgi:hypothetical protein